MHCEIVFYWSLKIMIQGKDILFNINAIVMPSDVSPEFREIIVCGFLWFLSVCTLVISVFRSTNIYLSFKNLLNIIHYNVLPCCASYYVFQFYTNNPQYYNLKNHSSKFGASTICTQPSFNNHKEEYLTVLMISHFFMLRFENEKMKILVHRSSKYLKSKIFLLKGMI